jgi:hypothetical protein
MPKRKFVSGLGPEGTGQAASVESGHLLRREPQQEALGRWVMKANDPKTLEDMDAVFVTVEARGWIVPQ